MELSYFDLHCDTAYEMHRTHQCFWQNNLAVSGQKASCFSQYTQVMAIWSDSLLGDEEAYQNTLRVIEHLRLQARLPRMLLALEDARILAGHIERLDAFIDMGVRILTPLWRGKTCIGGAYDTNEGLTAFGKDVIRRCFAMGVIPDISHASVASSSDIFDLNTDHQRILATHSAFYDVHPHPRNLHRDQLLRILRCDGLMGLTLCPAHLGYQEEGQAVDAVFAHIDYALAQGAARNIGFGCDFDGMTPPNDLCDISCMYSLAERMLRHNYSETIVHQIFYQNAERVLYSIISSKEGKRT